MLQKKEENSTAFLGQTLPTEVFLLLDQALIQLQAVRSNCSACHLHCVKDAHVQPILWAEQETDDSSTCLLSPASHWHSCVMIRYRNNSQLQD